MGFFHVVNCCRKMNKQQNLNVRIHNTVATTTEVTTLHHERSTHARGFTHTCIAWSFYLCAHAPFTISNFHYVVKFIRFFHELTTHKKKT